MRFLKTTLGRVGVGLIMATLSIAMAAPAALAASPQLASTSATPSEPCVSPPAGFNPLAASDIQLLTYGLPPRPSAASSSFDQWVMAVTHAKKRGCDEHVVPSAQTPHKGSLNASNGYNWSGWVAMNETYYVASGQWTIPCVNAGQSPADSDVGDWVGLGGVNGSLLQAGTYWDHSARAWKSFYEEVGSGSHTPGPDEFANETCGHNMFAEIDYDQSYVSQSYYLVEDVTNGEYWSSHNNFAPAFATAEWIDEATTCDNYHNWRKLASFGDVFWTYDGAGLSYSSEHTISYWPRVQWYSSANTNPNLETAAPGPLNSTGNGFTDVFYNNGASVC